MIWPAAGRIAQLDDTSHTAKLIRLTDATEPMTLRTCR